MSNEDKVRGQLHVLAKKVGSISRIASLLGMSQATLSRHFADPKMLTLNELWGLSMIAKSFDVKFDPVGGTEWFQS